MVLLPVMLLLAVVCLSLLQVSESHFVTLSSLLSISHLGFLFFSFFGVLRIVVFSVLTSFYFVFLFFMNKKRIGSDLNWRLPPRRVHSNTWCQGCPWVGLGRVCAQPGTDPPVSGDKEMHSPLTADPRSNWIGRIRPSTGGERVGRGRKSRKRRKSV